MFLTAFLLVLAVSLPSSAEWTYTNLHPSGAQHSYVEDLSGGRQIGYATINYYARASIWTGTAESRVDLQPAGATESRAYDIANGVQVGMARFGSYYHAGLWTGSAASWVDLNPAGATQSYAWDVSGDQQVGHAQFNGVWHAGVWNGTAERWNDLHPDGTASSYLLGISGQWQSGDVRVGSWDHASIWNGTADSWEDLHTLLPARFSHSYANAIEVSGNDIWVGGYAWDLSIDRREAVLWHTVIPEPSSFLALGTGLGTLAGVFGRKTRRHRDRRTP